MSNDIFLPPGMGQATSVADNTVTSAKIVDGTITATDIATGTISSLKILDATIDEIDLDASTNASLTLANSALQPSALNPIKDSAIAVCADADTTKKFNWDLSGLTTAVITTLKPLLAASTVLSIRPMVDNTGNIIVQNGSSGMIFIGADATLGGANSGIQYSNAGTANRAQIKLHSFFNGNSVAGVSTLTSRSGVVGTNAAVINGQEYSKWTAQAGATTAGSAPISGSFAFKANTVNSLTVTSDWELKLTNLAGTLATAILVGSEGTLAVTGSISASNFSGTHSGTSSGTNTGDQNLFSTLTVAGQSDIVADSTSDTLTIVAGTGISLITNAGTDTLTITNSGVAGNTFSTVSVSGQSDVVADTTSDTLTLAAGTGITLTTNAGTDTVTIAASGGSSDLVKIQTVTASSSASIEFKNGSNSVVFDGTYSLYILKYFNVKPSVLSEQIYLTLSHNTGSTYVSTNYAYTTTRQQPTSTTASVGNANTTAIPTTTLGVDNTSDEGYAGEIVFYNPSNTTNHKRLQLSCHYLTDSSVYTQEHMSASIYDADTAVNAFKFTPGSGNIAAGTFILYGVK